MDMIWPLAVDTWGDDEREAIIRVLDSGRRTMGDEVRAFEAEFAERVGAKYAVAVNSGSSANLLMVAGMVHHPYRPMHPGTEIVVPAVGWSTTYAPLQQYGFRLRIVDVDPRTFALRIDDTSVPVMAVNVLGHPASVGDTPFLFEDNCESMAPLRGAVASYSTFFSHHMTTGEGGMVVTNDRDLYETMLCLRAHGWTRDLPGADRSEFRFLLPGYNLRPTEMQGAVGRVQLRKLPEFLKCRDGNKHRVRAYVGDAPWLKLQSTCSEPMAFSGVIDPDAPVTRDEVRAVFQEHGIETRTVLGGNILRQPMRAHLTYTAGPTPVADAIHDRGIMFGNFGHKVSHEQIDALVGALRKSWRDGHKWS